MASKRRVRRNACTGKVRHRQASHAAYHVKLLRDKGEQSIGYYRCRFCNGWHVGHRPRKQFNQQGG